MKADAREQLARVVLDFRHDPSGRGPAVRLVVETLVPDERLAAGPTHRTKQDIGDLPLEILVGRDADRVLDAACLQRLVDLRLRKGGVGAERHMLPLRLLALDLRYQQRVPVLSRAFGPAELPVTIAAAARVRRELFPAQKHSE